MTGPGGMDVDIRSRMAFEASALLSPARSVFECASVVVRLGGNRGSAAISWGGGGGAEPQSRASGRRPRSFYHW